MGFVYRVGSGRKQREHRRVQGSGNRNLLRVRMALCHRQCAVQNLQLAITRMLCRICKGVTGSMPWAICCIDSWGGGGYGFYTIDSVLLTSPLFGLVYDYGKGSLFTHVYHIVLIHQ